MASIYKDIRAAFETELAGISGVPAISYENLKYDRATGTQFIEAQLIPTERKPAVRGLNPQQRYEGLFRIICYVPEGSGPGAADTLADLILDAFPAATDISYTNADLDTYNVSIDYSEREAGGVDGAYYYVPVNIGFYIYN